MQVQFDPDAPHLLRLTAESNADIDTLGTLKVQGPLRAAANITRPHEGGHLVIGLVWDTRGCPTVGAAVSPADVLRREAARKLASGLGELFSLALRQMQGDGVVQADTAAPDPQEQTSAFFEQLEFVKPAAAVGARRAQRRVDEVQGSHADGSFVTGGMPS